MKTLTFRVYNDRGVVVEKTSKLEWIKDDIRRNFKETTGKSIGVFTVEVRENTRPVDPAFAEWPVFTNEILVKGKNGQTMIYHYGGFDGLEGVEPYDHSEWFKTKEEAVA